MSQLPLFISTRAAHLREARLWAERVPAYPEHDKKKAVKLVIKHLLGSIQAGIK